MKVLEGIRLFRLVHNFCLLPMSFEWILIILGALALYKYKNITSQMSVLSSSDQKNILRLSKM